MDFAEALGRVRLGRLASQVLFYPTIGSTNDVAGALATRRGDVEGAVVLADEQTAGRGRRGHVWHSPPGSGLYVSVILGPGGARVDPDRATMLVTLMAGVALVEGIEAATGLRPDLKWPNDLLVGGRKLAGILSEGVGSGTHASPSRVSSVIVGYGINIAQTAYPPDVAARATSLETELGRAVDRTLVFAQTLASLAARYDDLLAGRFDAILDAWRRLAPAAAGARVTWASATGSQSGVTAGIDDRGALLVRIGDRIERVVAGEVTWS
ncbi:MAG TPA: biotin--[acetyl-CoA-carboxylase] ligase [Vicinamibacterales bacterium]|nr:biotin--[acetyl-CoA-carboxylase] ligase [Vicinamibacterales bacterium]